MVELPPDIPVPASTTGMVTVNVLLEGTEITSNVFVVKLAFEKVVTPPPAKLGDVNLM